MNESIFCRILGHKFIRHMRFIENRKYEGEPCVESLFACSYRCGRCGTPRVLETNNKKT